MLVGKGRSQGHLIKANMVQIVSSHGLQQTFPGKGKWESKKGNFQGGKQSRSRRVGTFLLKLQKSTLQIV